MQLNPAQDTVHGQAAPRASPAIPKPGLGVLVPGLTQTPRGSYSFPQGVLFMATSLWEQGITSSGKSESDCAQPQSLDGPC